MLGIYLQASSIISFFFCIAISVLWFYSEPVLVLLHQNSSISKMAALYIKYLIPGLFAYGILQNMLRFLQTQSVVIPPVLCSVLPLGLHLGMAYLLIHKTGLGFKGAPLAASISFWFSVFMLGMYVNYAKKLKHTWRGFSWDSFHYVFVALKLALPSSAMVW